MRKHLNPAKLDKKLCNAQFKNCDTVEKTTPNQNTY